MPSTDLSSTRRHTPGPWVWHGDYTLRPAAPDPERSPTHTILSPDGPFGFLGTDHSQVEAEWQANRRLMEAAPALLAALQRLCLVYALEIDAMQAKAPRRAAWTVALQAMDAATGSAT